MQNILAVLSPVLGLAIGFGVGAGFGWFQQAAKRYNQRQEAQGNFKSVWRIMPGAGARVVFLLLALVLIQILCPQLFVDGTQWWVTGGVVGGYGLMLYKALREHMAQSM